MAPPPDGGAGPAEAPKAPPIPEANPAFPRPASAALAQDSSSGSSQSEGGAKSPGAPGSEDSSTNEEVKDGQPIPTYLGGIIAGVTGLSLWSFFSGSDTKATPAEVDKVLNAAMENFSHSREGSVYQDSNLYLRGPMLGLRNVEFKITDDMEQAGTSKLTSLSGTSYVIESTFKVEASLEAELDKPPGEHARWGYSAIHLLTTSQLKRESGAKIELSTVEYIIKDPFESDLNLKWREKWDYKDLYADYAESFAHYFGDEYKKLLSNAKMF